MNVGAALRGRPLFDPQLSESGTEGVATEGTPYNYSA
jgi:hypothetical protein